MVAKPPRVSLGVPVYNGEMFVASALDSLLAQTYQDFEIIISDNASTDRTEEICRSRAARDSRIRYFRNSANIGISGNYSRTLEMSSGEFFKWAACDDLCAPQYLTLCVEALDEHPSAVLAYPRTKLIDERGEIISEYQEGLHLQSDSACERLRQLLDHIYLCNVIFGVIRANVLRKVSALGKYAASDKSLMAELSLHGKFWEVPEFMFYRRFHPNASSHLNEGDKLLDYLEPEVAARKRVPLTQWSQHWHLFRSAARVPLGLRERMRVALFLTQRLAWNRVKLTRELSGVISQKLHRS